ncbi:MAG: rhamnogalacturonan lyase, partial [Desulfatitalea sp.]|nr:rhamnogalacturonan lyase [Desulfatitalea sp.]
MFAGAMLRKEQTMNALRRTMLLAVLGLLFFGVEMAGAARTMESLNRGLVRANQSSGNFLSWRLFGTDPTGIGFNVYRGTTKLTSAPIANSTNYLDTGGSSSSSYTVRPVINGVEQGSSETSLNLSTNYLQIPLKTLSGHTPNDASVGDLDGDGVYEIVVKQEMSPQDNSNAGTTGQTKLEAYKLNGTLMWRINLGINIREGAHYTQFLVYDFDSDGKAEVVCKTADGTQDGV